MQEIPQTNKFYKAEEIADKLGVKKFVIRTWEKQFSLNRVGSQYTEEDLTIFESIRDLLYQDKLPPTLVKQRLPEVLAKKASLIKPTEEIKQEIAAQPLTNDIIQEVTLPETINVQASDDIKPSTEEIVGATLSSNSEEAAQDQVRPAFKQNEEFWNNLKTFKEQLLKIQEQLK